MNKKEYFPFEVNMISKSNISELIEAHGPKGFGTYIMVLTELRHNPNYRCSLKSLRGIARRCKISLRVLNQVIYDFQLFEISQEDEVIIVSSPYLDRVMGAYDEKNLKRSEAAKKIQNKSEQKKEEQITDTIGTLREEKKREEKKKNTTAVVQKEKSLPINQQQEKETAAAAAAAAAETHIPAEDKARDWEQHLDQAVKDETWMEVVAMSSGISRLFVKHRQVAIEAFRQHVRLQGKERDIQSLKDAKTYLANFTRQGTPTQKRLAVQLEQLDEAFRHTDPGRYETLDPQTGRRSYFGNLIPPDAPPRPNDNAVWSPQLKQWI